jgi:hypothetical protein
LPFAMSIRRTPGEPDFTPAHDLGIELYGNDVFIRNDHCGERVSDFCPTLWKIRIVTRPMCEGNEALVVFDEVDQEILGIVRRDQNADTFSRRKAVEILLNPPLQVIKEHFVEHGSKINEKPQKAQRQKELRYHPVFW